MNKKDIASSINVVSAIIDSEHIFTQWHKLSATAQPAITCSKLTIETLEQGVHFELI